MVNQIKEKIPNGLIKHIRLVLNKIFYPLHQGNTYTCPFCNFRAKDLALIGHDIQVLTERQVVGGGQRFGGCYKCGSTDRERLIFIYLKDKIKLFEPENRAQHILHIAPEVKISNRLLQLGFKNYVCGDLFTKQYTYPKHVKNINILNIPYPDEVFELIICNHVLEHIPTDLVAMKELQRVLKVGGKAILQVPISKNSAKTLEDFSVTDPKQRKIVFGQFDHVRIYGQDYFARLAQAGFTVNRINIASEYPQYGFNSDEEIILCEKK